MGLPAGGREVDAALSADERKLLEEGTLADRGIQARPRPYYKAMRKGDPIHYDKGLNSWLVTRHEDISAVQSDPVTFSVQHGYSEQQARGMQEEFRNYLREHGGGCPLKIDWFSSRDVNVVEPVVIHGLSEGRKAPLSDHDPIGIDVVPA